MGCASSMPAGLTPAKKREAICGTPFFAAAAESDAPSAKTLIDQLASEANVRNLGVGAGLDDVPFGVCGPQVAAELISAGRDARRAAARPSPR